MSDKADPLDATTSSVLTAAMSLFAESGVGVALVTANGDWLNVNQSLCDLLAQPREKLLRTASRTGAIPRELAADIESCIRRLHRNHGTTTGITRYPLPDGGTAFLKLTVSIAGKPDPGAPGHFVLVVDDLTPFYLELQQNASESDRQMRASQRKLSLHLQQTMLGMIEWDDQLRVRAWNPAAASIFGYSSEQAIGRTALELIVPSEETAEAAAGATFFTGPGGEFSVSEYRAKDGRRIVCEWFNTGLTDEDGRMTGALSLVRDITEQRDAQQFMQRQRLLDAIMTEILGRFATCAGDEVDGNVEFALKRLAGFVGVDHAHVIVFSGDRTCYTVTHEWCGPGVARQGHAYVDVPVGTLAWTEKMVLEDRVVRINTFDDFPAEAAAERNTPDRRAGSQSILLVPIRGTARVIVGVIGLDSHARPISWSDADISSCKMVGDAIANVLERKRSELARTDLAQRLISAQELERTRIARELHDDIGQSLALLGIQLQRLEPSAGPKANRPAPKLAELRERVKEIAGKVGRLSHQLHSSELEFLGLAAAVEGLCREFSAEYQLVLKHRCTSVPANLDQGLALCFLRVLQETLHNISKHSQAHHAELELSACDGELVFRAEDDGIGFDPGAQRRKPGLGLVSMRERLHLVGGSLTVVSTPGGGTKIEARAPIKLAQKS